MPDFLHFIHINWDLFLASNFLISNQRLNRSLSASEILNNIRLNLLKKSITVLSSAALVMVSMSYASADQGGVLPKLAQVIKQECGARPTTGSILELTTYEVCEQVAIARYKATED